MEIDFNQFIHCIIDNAQKLFIILKNNLPLATFSLSLTVAYLTFQLQKRNERTILNKQLFDELLINRLPKNICEYLKEPDKNEQELIENIEELKKLGLFFKITNRKKFRFLNYLTNKLNDQISHYSNLHDNGTNKPNGRDYIKTQNKILKISQKIYKLIYGKYIDYTEDFVYSTYEKVIETTRDKVSEYSKSIKQKRKQKPKKRK